MMSITMLTSTIQGNTRPITFCRMNKLKKSIPDICEHLQPLLDAMLARGAAVEAVETGWTAVDLVVVLSEGFSPGVAREEARRHNVEFWECNDPHYSIEYGFICKTDKHCLSWPQDKAILDTRSAI
jgi:hypothetical protein